VSNATAKNTHASNFEVIDNNFSSQSTQISEYEPDSLTSHSNEATIWTEFSFSKYLNHPIFFS